MSDSKKAVSLSFLKHYIPLVSTIFINSFFINHIKFSEIQALFESGKRMVMVMLEVMVLIRLKDTWFQLQFSKGFIIDYKQKSSTLQHPQGFFDRIFCVFEMVYAAQEEHWVECFFAFIILEPANRHILSRYARIRIDSGIFDCFICKYIFI